MAKTCEFLAEASLTATPLLPPVSTPPPSSSKANHVLKIGGYAVEGVSIGGKETCVIFPIFSLTSDIGLCLQRAVSQEFLFISHGHLDHIGGLPMYVSARGVLRLRPPTIFIPACLRDLVEQLFEVHRAITRSELKHNLVPLEVGEEYQLRRDLKVRAFRTYHVLPSQGYVIYSVKEKIKQEFIGLPSSEIKRLRSRIRCPPLRLLSQEIQHQISLFDPDNADVLTAKILVVESTFLDDSVSVEHARKHGHTHLRELVGQSDKLLNKAILLIHFSARYTSEDIDAATNRLPLSFRSRVYALKEGF